MKKKVEIDNLDSCLNKADADEPLFVLRANDELAPDIVREWARMYDQQKRGEGVTEEQIAKHEEALDIADLMEDWKRDQRLMDNGGRMTPIGEQNEHSDL